jgi:hypothetical protein
MKTTIHDLKQQVDDLGARFPKLSNDNLFVVWYLMAMLVEDERTAAEATIGAAGDKSVDAVYIDDDVRCTFVVQAKYREKIKAASEGRPDVMASRHWPKSSLARLRRSRSTRQRRTHSSPNV